MEKLTHWTQESVEAFVYSISSAFMSQLESRMECKEISQGELAARLGKTEGRVSQVLNNPGNLGLKLIVEYSRALGMKVGIVPYDDNDPNNDRGPINPDVFVKSWEKLGRPSDLFEVDEAGIRHGDMYDQFLDPYSAVARFGAHSVAAQPKPVYLLEEMNASLNLGFNKLLVAQQPDKPKPAWSGAQISNFPMEKAS